MKRTLWILGSLAIAALGVAAFTSTPACASGGCGIVPIRPIPPIGCRNLCPSCQCDSTGLRCSWVWVCCG